MQKIRIFVLLVFLSSFLGGYSQKMENWEEGFLDIHHINTGRGDAVFMILPDGTTLLMDAGSNLRKGERVVTPKPNDSLRAGEWIAEYIRRVIPGNKNFVDYALLTHYHSDHIDGISDVYKSCPIGKVVDRGSEFMPPAASDSCYARYSNFLKSEEIKREVFEVGSSNQFPLKHETGKYDTLFQIRNVYANGSLWSADKKGTTVLFADTVYEKRDRPRENMYSCVIKLSYGDFDYYSGGDIPGFPRPGRPAWHDIESPVSQSVGRVEVAVLNHHGNEDGTNSTFLANLAPRNIIMSTWDALHPNHTVLYRLFSKELYPGERNVFATNLHPATKIVIGELVNKMAAKEGHIVVRVLPGGGEYYIYVLDDNNMNLNVRTTFGPFHSKH